MADRPSANGIRRANGHVDKTRTGRDRMQQGHRHHDHHHHHHRDQQQQDVDLNLLFQACDTNRSGDIDYNEFSDICSQLQLQPGQADALFRDLDTDSDGAIDFQEFSQGYSHIAESLGQVNGQAGEPGDPREQEQASSGLDDRATWEDFAETLSGLHAISGQDSVAQLYQQIVATSDTHLLQSYEHVVRELVGAIERQGDETERIAGILKRSQEQVVQQLGEMEDEMEQRLLAHGQKIRKEERTRAEHVISDLKRHYEAEATDLHVAIKKLKKLENIARCTDSAEDVMELKKRLGEITLENQKLKKNLLESQTNALLIQSELDTLKTEITNRTLSFEQEQMTIKELAEERIGLLRQIEVLQATNRKLQDSNDGMRSVVESSFSSQRKSASNQSTPPSHMTPYQSTPRSPNHSSDRRRSSQRYDRCISLLPLEHEADSLALCDPMLRARRASACGETESLGAVSWSDSGLSMQQEDAPNGGDGSDSETDGEEGDDHAAHAAKRRRGRSSVPAVASDADASELTGNSPATAKVAVPARGDWSPSVPVSRSSSSASSRRFIPAFRLRRESSQRGEAPPSRSDRVYKLVLAGDAAVGKSSFLLRLCKNEFRKDTTATLGVDFQMKTLIVDGEHMSFQLWDTAGQERFRSIAKSYFRRADGVLLLYDVTCEKTFLNVRDWIDIIEDSAPRSIPVMLVGNKSDLRSEPPGPNQKYVSHTFGEKLAMNYNALFCETSAMDGSNIVETVLHLAREVKKRANSLDSRSFAGIKVEDENKKASKCCKI